MYTLFHFILPFSDLSRTVIFVRYRFLPPSKRQPRYYIKTHAQLQELFFHEKTFAF